MRVVQFSTGVASAEVALREVAAHGAEKVLLLTADTRAEDPDNWRFAHEVVDRLGAVRWVVLADGRTPMQVGRDHRCVPNDRMDVCSRVLKRQLLRRWIDEHCDPAEDTIVLGFDWTEQHRLAKAEPLWAPFCVEAPLCDPPYVDKADLLDRFVGMGIEPPRLYRQGFQHANCYGACVRAGQAAWVLLLRTNPAVYRRWEDEEEQTRQLLGKDVAILSDRRNLAPGEKRRSLPLRVFRERVQAQQSFDASDRGPGREGTRLLAQLHRRAGGCVCSSCPAVGSVLLRPPPGGRVMADQPTDGKLTPPEGWRFAWLDELPPGTLFRYHRDDRDRRTVDRSADRPHSLVLTRAVCPVCSGSGVVA